MVYANTLRSFLSQYLQRDHNFVLMAAPGVKTDGIADRQRHRQPHRHGEVPVQLEAHILQRLVAFIAGIGVEYAREHRAADRTEIETLRSHIVEADRREIELAGQLGKAARPDVVDAKAGEAVIVAIA